MPVLNRRKPRASGGQSDEEEAPPSKPRRQQRQSSEENEIEEVSSGGDDDNGVQHEDTDLAQAVKNLVRLAMACEVRRQVVRRADVTTKVLSTSRVPFKKVFNAARSELREKFGMDLEELPLKEKVTIAQKRNAQVQNKVQTNSGMWILVSTLPADFRSPLVLPPGIGPTPFDEATYTGLYTFMLSVIVLSGGCIAESRMMRYIAQVSGADAADKNTEKLLARMVKDRYILRERDGAVPSGAEERFDYYVGPRGRVEVSSESVAGVVRAVYDPQGQNAVDELEKKIAGSLGIKPKERVTVNEDDTDEDSVAGAVADEGQRRRSKRTRDAD
ncbi:MAG: hypothetical protein M1814_002891 [Vezdaea aestivalis]|nr:MAG: hypothetical protein M1814_002891 [Vezdaea aestivalis]